MTDYYVDYYVHFICLCFNLHVKQAAIVQRWRQRIVWTGSVTTAWITARKPLWRAEEGGHAMGTQDSECMKGLGTWRNNALHCSRIHVRHWWNSLMFLFCCRPSHTHGCLELECPSRLLLLALSRSVFCRVMLMCNRLKYRPGSVVNVIQLNKTVRFYPPVVTADLWRAAIRRGHTGATLRSSTTTRWRRWRRRGYKHWLGSVFGCNKCGSVYLWVLLSVVLFICQNGLLASWPQVARFTVEVKNKMLLYSSCVTPLHFCQGQISRSRMSKS